MDDKSESKQRQNLLLGWEKQLQFQNESPLIMRNVSFDLHWWFIKITLVTLETCFRMQHGWNQKAPITEDHILQWHIKRTDKQMMYKAFTQSRCKSVSKLLFFVHLFTAHTTREKTMPVKVFFFNRDVAKDKFNSLSKKKKKTWCPTCITLKASKTTPLHFT